MPSFFKTVQLLCIQMLLASTAFASTGVKCSVSQGPVGFGYRLECDNLKRSWYPNFESLLVDLYAVERHHLVSFDWERIQTICRELNKRADFCERL